VIQFNKDLLRWYADYGCTVEFGWVYNHAGRKLLEISAIDLSVHRRGLPDGESIASLLEKAENT
jgi:hypothetical protein